MSAERLNVSDLAVPNNNTALWKSLRNLVN